MGILTCGSPIKHELTFSFWQSPTAGIPKYANKAKQRAKMGILTKALPEEAPEAVESLHAAAGERAWAPGQSDPRVTTNQWRCYHGSLSRSQKRRARE